mgnify:CR=1 FL=1
MPKPDKRFEMPISVAPSDIDELGHVNNVVYVRWVQEVAIAHWQSEAPANDKAKLRWVVVRHEIDYKHPAYEDDEIIATTWVGTATRTTFRRYTEIVRAKDRKVFARALTFWVPIDTSTGKLTTVSADVRSKFSVPDVPE